MTETDGSDFYYPFALAWVALAVICLIALLFIPAPYGKFTRKGFGPVVDRRAGWIAMETPAALAMIFFFAFGRSPGDTVMIVFLAMWEIHYLYRAFVFPFRMRGEKRNMTLVPVSLGVVFNVGNAYLNGHYVFTMAGPYPADWLVDPRFLVGAGLFAVGFYIHVHSDGLLRSLRKPGETGYQIPRDGLFEQVSQANYFGELVEWAGWALATWSVGGVVFFIWTASNLIPRARSHHKWYKANFPDYPPQRKAVIPFVF